MSFEKYLKEGIKTRWGIYRQNRKVEKALDYLKTHEEYNDLLSLLSIFLKKGDETSELRFKAKLSEMLSDNRKDDYWYHEVNNIAGALIQKENK